MFVGGICLFRRSIPSGSSDAVVGSFAELQVLIVEILLSGGDFSDISKYLLCSKSGDHNFVISVPSMVMIPVGWWESSWICLLDGFHSSYAYTR